MRVRVELILIILIKLIILIELIILVKLIIHFGLIRICLFHLLHLLLRLHLEHLLHLLDLRCIELRLSRHLILFQTLLVVHRCIIDWHFILGPVKKLRIVLDLYIFLIESLEFGLRGLLLVSQFIYFVFKYHSAFIVFILDGLGFLLLQKIELLAIFLDNLLLFFDLFSLDKIFIIDS